MIDFFNKLILVLCCCTFAITYTNNYGMLIPLIIAITFTSLSGFFTRHWLNITFFLIYVFLSVLQINFFYFIPLLLYDIFKEKYELAFFISLIPFLYQYQHISIMEMVQLLVLIAVSYIIKSHTHNLTVLEKKHIELRDETTELSEALRHKNTELLEKQDYEITMATLNERNRISGEIHDNIGHLLSSAILQIGALMTITKEALIKENLKQLKNTLSDGMNSIRNSIHDIHEKSINLEVQLENLTHNFSFCPASLEYEIDNDLPLKAKYAVMFIVKEALSNIIKHSNATKVQITLMEHPGFYQLIIIDNGSKIHSPISSSDKGMGLNNIRKRISELDGLINISIDYGYRIFISFPKGESNFENPNY